MTAYRKDSDETKYASYLVKDDELLEKNNEIWEKVKITSKKKKKKKKIEQSLQCKISKS